jgi:hypothetical protein
MVDRSHAYAVIGIATAAVLATLTAPYWEFDGFVLAFSALMIAQYCLQKVELPPWLRVKKPEVRSKVFHYSEIARKDRRHSSRKWVVDDKSEVFLNAELKNLPREELEQLEAELQAAERMSIWRR